MSDPNAAKPASPPNPASDPEKNEAYPRPRVRLARNWVQPKRPFNFDKDYHNLPRFRPDFGKAPRQFASKRRGR